MPSSVTHEERLAEAMPELNQFVRVMENLGPKLGPLLLQFPYAFKPDQFDVLARFLEGLPSGVKFAVEVRHRGWLNEKFYELLRARKVALALIDLLWMPRLDVLTADWTYLRFIGDRKGIEKKTKTWEKIIVDRAAEMAVWTPKIRAFLDKGIPVWAYFNNHYAGHAPGSVDLFLEVLEKFRAKGDVTSRAAAPRPSGIPDDPEESPSGPEHTGRNPTSSAPGSAAD